MSTSIHESVGQGEGMEDKVIRRGRASVKKVVRVRKLNKRSRRGDSEARGPGQGGLANQRGPRRSGVRRSRARGEEKTRREDRERRGKGQGTVAHRKGPGTAGKGVGNGGLEEREKQCERTGMASIRTSGWWELASSTVRRQSSHPPLLYFLSVNVVAWAVNTFNSPRSSLVKWFDPTRVRAWQQEVTALRQGVPVEEVYPAVHRDVRPKVAVEDAIGGRGSSGTGSRRRDAEKSVSKEGFEAL
ncbi:hypothetical protein EI94DRAFT_1706196 [Lactarius quietus]|nr:hypothetical protein EI94DRAFT_1706196 [Lactarius quietus]